MDMPLILLQTDSENLQERLSQRIGYINTYAVTCYWASSEECTF